MTLIGHLFWAYGNKKFGNPIQDVKSHCASSLSLGLFLQPCPSLWYVFPRLSKPTETSKWSWKRHENPLCKSTVLCFLIHIPHIQTCFRISVIIIITWSRIHIIIIYMKILSSSLQVQVLLHLVLQLINIPWPFVHSCLRLHIWRSLQPWLLPLSVGYSLLPTMNPVHSLMQTGTRLGMLPCKMKFRSCALTTLDSWFLFIL
jgi:hypothetical protein